MGFLGLRVSKRFYLKFKKEKMVSRLGSPNDGVRRHVVFKVCSSCNSNNWILKFLSVLKLDPQAYNSHKS